MEFVWEKPKTLVVKITVLFTMCFASLNLAHDLL